MPSSYQKLTRWDYHSTGTEVVEALSNRVKDKTILITGPSEGGIGAATALALASASPSLLLLLGRSPAKVNPVIQEIHSKYPSVAVQFIHCDLSSQTSIRNASTDITTLLSGRTLDIIICNVAIMACPFLSQQMGLRAESPRVVIVSSSAHRGGVFRFEDWNFDGEGEKGIGRAYNEGKAYGQSKMANVLFAKSLARVMERRGGKGKAFSLHPESIKSGLQVHMLASDTLLAESIAKATAVEPKYGREFKREVPKTLDQGCSTTLVAALDPSIDNLSGAYLVNGDVAEHAPDEDYVTVENQDRLWALSEQMVVETFQ